MPGSRRSSPAQGKSTAAKEEYYTNLLHQHMYKRGLISLPELKAGKVSQEKYVGMFRGIEQCKFIARQGSLTKSRLVQSVGPGDGVGS